MEIKITAKNIAVPQDFSLHAEKKLKKLERFFGDGASENNWEAKIGLESVHNKVIIELTVFYGGIFFRAEEITLGDKSEALDKCTDKIIRQIRRNKTKIQKHLHDKAFEGAFETEEVDYTEDYSNLRIKTFDLRPLDVTEAIMQMNLLGHAFFMFVNAETGLVSVVYKRNGGGYALIQPEHK